MCTKSQQRHYILKINPEENTRPFKTTQCLWYTVLAFSPHLITDFFPSGDFQRLMAKANERTISLDLTLIVRFTTSIETITN